MKFSKYATDEIKAFRDNLLVSLNEMKSGRAARTTQAIVTAALEVALARACLTQG